MSVDRAVSSLPPLALSVETVSPATINSRHREEWWSWTKAPRFLLQCVYSVRNPTFLLRIQGGGQWINDCCLQVDILCNSCTRIRKWSDKVYNNRASTYHTRYFVLNCGGEVLCSDSYSEGPEIESQPTLCGCPRFQNKCENYTLQNYWDRFLQLSSCLNLTPHSGIRSCDISVVLAGNAL
jgi:hypothetical protein